MSGPEEFFEDQQFFAGRAIADGDMKRLRAVVRRAEIDRPGKKGMTLLWYAIQRKQFEAIEVLVTLGSKPQDQVVQGLGTPLTYALRPPRVDSSSTGAEAVWYSVGVTAASEPET